MTEQPIAKRLPIGQRVLFTSKDDFYDPRGVSVRMKNRPQGTVIAHHPHGEVVAWDDGFIDTLDDGNVYTYDEIARMEDEGGED